MDYLVISSFLECIPQISGFEVLKLYCLWIGWLVFVVGREYGRRMEGVS